MTDEIYERLYGGTGEIVAEVTEPVADEEVIEEKDYLPYYIAGGVGILVILAGSLIIPKKRKNH